MSTPEQQHNSLIATRELLKIIIDEERYPDVPEKIRMSVKSLLRDYPERDVIDKLYDGKTFSNTTLKTKENKVFNDNQTWDTPGFKWKTEVEFIPAE